LPALFRGSDVGFCSIHTSDKLTGQGLTQSLVPLSPCPEVSGAGLDIPTL
jgi:hypothetical protein